MELNFNLIFKDKKTEKSFNILALDNEPNKFDLLILISYDGEVRHELFKNLNKYYVVRT